MLREKAAFCLVVVLIAGFIVVVSCKKKPKKSTSGPAPGTPEWTTKKFLTGISNKTKSVGDMLVKEQRKKSRWKNGILLPSNGGTIKFTRTGSGTVKFSFKNSKGSGVTMHDPSKKKFELEMEKNPKGNFPVRIRVFSKAKSRNSRIQFGVFVLVKIDGDWKIDLEESAKASNLLD